MQQKVEQPKSDLSPALLWIMAIATGTCAANLYYCQPLLYQMQDSLGGSERDMGCIPTLTQVGYALGMLFLVPLGDMRERRRLIVIFTVISALTLVGVALSSTLPMAAVMSLLLGISTMTPQLIIPLAAHLAPEKKRGQVVGMVMSGLLLGILLARTVAGFVGAAFGWRAMFASASMVLFILAIVLHWMLPQSEPTFHGNYLKLLRSVMEIVIEQPALREAMVFGGMLFAAFSVFWATLIHLMESDAFHLGARTVGLFGLLGAAGALVAPVVGKIADRRSPRVSTGLGLLITAISYVVYWMWGGESLAALAVGVLLMDIGVQGGHVSNQSRIFALLPHARSRVNTAYMFAYFVGGAMGSYLGTIAWSVYRWPGVCATAMGFLAMGGLTYWRGSAVKASTE
jgi:predicted MFS family arabinose efflux permease